MHELCFTPCTGPSLLAVLRTVSVLLPSWPPLATSSTQLMLPMSKDWDNCYCRNSGNTILCIIQVLQTQRNFLWFRSHHQILLMPVIWWRPSTRFSHYYLPEPQVQIAKTACETSGLTYTCGSICDSIYTLSIVGQLMTCCCSEIVYAWSSCKLNYCLLLSSSSFSLQACIAHRRVYCDVAWTSGSDCVGTAWCDCDCSSHLPAEVVSSCVFSGRQHCHWVREDGCQNRGTPSLIFGGPESVFIND